jgi:hypothetical protein
VCRENISVLYTRVPRLLADLAIAHGYARYPLERRLSPHEIAGTVHTILNEEAGAVRAVLEYAARAMTATVSAEGPSVARTPMRPTSERQPM